MGEIIAIIGAIGVVTGIYFKVRQSRREAYPKRVAIFRCTEEFLARAWTDPDADAEDLLRNFYQCKREAPFIFNKKIATYLDSLYEGVENHFDLEMKLEIQGDSLSFEERQSLQHRVFASRHWLSEENTHLKKRFNKYLKF